MSAKCIQKFDQLDKAVKCLCSPWREMRAAKTKGATSLDRYLKLCLGKFKPKDHEMVEIRTKCKLWD